MASEASPTASWQNRILWAKLSIILYHIICLNIHFCQIATKGKIADCDLPTSREEVWTMLLMTSPELVICSESSLPLGMHRASSNSCCRGGLSPGCVFRGGYQGKTLECVFCWRVSKRIIGYNIGWAWPRDTLYTRTWKRSLLDWIISDEKRRAKRWNVISESLRILQCKLRNMYIVSLNLSPPLVFVVFLSSGFCLALALVARVCYILFFVCFFFVFCLGFQIIRFVISTFTPIFFIEISFVSLPPPLQNVTLMFPAPFASSPTIKELSFSSVIVSSSRLLTP